MPSTDLVALVDAPPVPVVGLVADQVASSHLFADYRRRLAPNTRSRHDACLAHFAAFLTATHAEEVEAAALAQDATRWQGVTWGLVAAFVQWQLQRGYAVGTVNGELSVLKVYTGLAFQARAISEEQHARIALVKGYGQRQGRNLDREREQTRVGAKKAQAVSISPQQAAALKQQPNTPQGRRDALLMCLLLDHGLRCGEVAALEVKALAAGARGGSLTFYRAKVDRTQTHHLTPDTLAAARAYLKRGGWSRMRALPSGFLQGGKEGEGKSIGQERPVINPDLAP